MLQLNDTKITQSHYARSSISCSWFDINKFAKNTLLKLTFTFMICNLILYGDAQNPL